MTVTLISFLETEPPKWIVPPREEAVVQPQALPNLVAVDERIAKRVNALRPCVKKRLARVAAKLPPEVTLLVTSAYRTREEQAALRPTFGVKAAPGRSAHEDGRAVDVNVLIDGERVNSRRNHEIIGTEMASEGFQHLGPSDPVHYSIPKEEIDAALQSGPDLQVMTWDELREQQASSAPGIGAIGAAVGAVERGVSTLGGM